jgi:hypothetical protein
MRAALGVAAFTAMGFAGLFAACADFRSAEEADAGIDAASDQSIADDGGGPADTGPRRCDLSQEFGAPTDVPGLIGLVISDFSLDDTELEATFTMRRLPDGGGPFSIFHSSRASIADPFAEPVPHEALNTAPDTTQSNRAGTLSPSGLTLIYYSSIGSDFRLWKSTRALASPTSAFPAGTEAPVPGLDVALVHPEWVSPTLVIVSTFGEGHVYRLAWNGAEITGAQPIAELDPYRPTRAFASADQEVIVFDSQDLDGGMHLQEARRNGQPTFGTPRAITELTGIIDAGPNGESVHWISRDGCRIYFGASGLGGVKVAARK